MSRDWVTPASAARNRTNCPDTTCTYSQTGYPGGAGFSLEWDILGNDATVIEVVNHY
jgi:hypothetical protein